MDSYRREGGHSEQEPHDAALMGGRQDELAASWAWSRARARGSGLVTATAAVATELAVRPQQATSRPALLDHAMRVANDYESKLSSLPVSADASEAGAKRLHAALGGALQREGADPHAMLDLFASLIPDYTVASSGGRCFDLVIGGHLPVADAFQMVLTAVDPFGGKYDTAPLFSVAEQVALRWTSDLLGFTAGRDVSSAFATGSTAGHIIALAAARHRLLADRGWDVERNGLRNAPEITVVVGADHHVSILKALQVLGLGRDEVRVVATDDEGRMRPDVLAEVLASIDHPAIVCAQLGEINTGAFDPLEQIARTLRPGDWLHADGAFGAWPAVVPELAHLTAGLELCDSLTTDAHKMPQALYGLGMVFIADRDAHRAAMSTQAAYISIGRDTREPLQVDAKNYSLEIARGAYGVQLWAILRHLGRDGVTDMIRRSHRNALRMATNLRAGGIHIPNRVVFNQVLINCAPEQLTNAADAGQFVGAVMAEIDKDGVCRVGGTAWRDRPMLRVSVASAATTTDDIDASSNAICAAVDRVARRWGIRPDSTRPRGQS